MSHCVSCLDKLSGCPGCGHEDLEAKLAEAHAQITYERERNRNNVALACEERDALKATLAEAEAKFAEILATIDNERIALKATLAQVREWSREMGPLRNMLPSTGEPTNPLMQFALGFDGLDVALAALDAGQEEARG